jgi:hypothetical protein
MRGTSGAVVMSVACPPAEQTHHDVIAGACRDAWNCLTVDPSRVASAGR